VGWAEINIMIMNKLPVIFAGLLFSAITAFGQEPIDVTEQTIKLGGMQEEELYYGFAAGDKIIFSFRETGGQEIKEVEITEYPGNSRFSAYKTSHVDNKTITVSTQGVYIFRIKNSALAGRVCLIKIQRVPVSGDTRNFNTAVTWEMRPDTTYSTCTREAVIGYDTSYIQKTKKELVKTEISEDIIADKTERVHSRNNLQHKNYSILPVSLPQNEVTPFMTKTVRSWAYWIGVGKEASEAWLKNVNIIKNIASGASVILGGSPLAGIAIGTLATLAMPSMGEDVAYWFIPDYANARLFMEDKDFVQFDSGKGIAAYGKNTDRTQGTFYIGLLNDNQVQGIDVNVKISVILETKYYEDKPYLEISLTPRYGKKTFSEPVIRTVKVPVAGK